MVAVGGRNPAQNRAKTEEGRGGRTGHGGGCWTPATVTAAAAASGGSNGRRATAGRWWWHGAEGEKERGCVKGGGRWCTGREAGESRGIELV